MPAYYLLLKTYSITIGKYILKQGQASYTIRKHQTLFNISYKTKDTEILFLKCLLAYMNILFKNEHLIKLSINVHMYYFIFLLF